MSLCPKPKHEWVFECIHNTEWKNDFLKALINIIDDAGRAHCTRRHLLVSLVIMYGAGPTRSKERHFLAHNDDPRG